MAKQFKNQNATRATIVKYVKDGVTYSHTFAGHIGRDKIEQKMIMEMHVGRSQIGEHQFVG